MTHYSSPIVERGKVVGPERIDSIVFRGDASFSSPVPRAQRVLLEHTANIDRQDSLPVFALLKEISTQLETNNEVEALLSALWRRVHRTGPGADIVQNPGIFQLEETHTG